MKTVACVGAVLIGQLLVGVAQADDFGARFSPFSVANVGYGPYASTIGPTNTLTLKPAALRPLVGWRLDDQSVFGFGAAIEPVRFTGLMCPALCTADTSERFRATVGVGDGVSLFYITAGFGLHASRDDLTFGASYFAPEKWTTGLGLAYNLNPNARLWAQFDVTAYTFDGLPPGLRIGLPAAPATDLGLKGGITVPFAPHSDAFVPESGFWRWWEWLKPYFVPKDPDTMPK